MKLKGKRAIVTGASRGLGAKIAEVFEREGAEVVRLCRPEFDVRDEFSGADLYALLPADILVNNASEIGPIGPLVDNSFALWNAALETNLIAPVRFCKIFITASIGRQIKGSIINISGGGATSPRPNYSAYATAKCGLVRFSETLAAEVEQYGIRVNCVAPGLLNTRMGSPDGDPPDRAAELVAWLASDDSRPITGRLISAKWDPWDHPDFMEYIAGDANRLTLRRMVQ